MSYKLKNLVLCIKFAYILFCNQSNTFMQTVLILSNLYVHCMYENKQLKGLVEKLTYLKLL